MCVCLCECECECVCGGYAIHTYYYAGIVLHAIYSESCKQSAR